MPARIIRSSTSGELEAGPMVATILVLFGGRLTGLGAFMATTRSFQVQRFQRLPQNAGAAPESFALGGVQWHGNRGQTTFPPHQMRQGTRYVLAVGHCSNA